MRLSVARGIVFGGLIGGACDILYALGFFWWRGVAPTRVLQSVASGLLGTSAYDGGFATAALGLLLHFLMVIAAATLFYLVARRIAWLVRHPVIGGAAFGLGIYLAMNLVVLPLSAFPHKLAFPPPPLALWTSLAVHMFLVGVPIALCIRAAFGNRA